MLFGIFGTKLYVSTQTSNPQIFDMAVTYLRICCVTSFGKMCIRDSPMLSAISKADMTIKTTTAVTVTEKRFSISFIYTSHLSAAKTFIKTYTANNRTHILHISRTYMAYTVIQHIGTLALQPIRHLSLIHIYSSSACRRPSCTRRAL